MIFPRKKDNIATYLKPIVGDGYFFSGKPVVQSDGTLKWNGFFDAETADIYDGTYFLLPGTGEYTESPETTSKTWCFNYKNIAPASDLSLAEIFSTDSAEIATGTCDSGKTYLITATETDNFFTDCAVNDTFTSDGTETLDANNKVREIPTISLSSDSVTTTGFDNAQVQTIDKGDWITVKVTADTAVTGKLRLGKVGQSYGNIGVFNQIMTSDVISDATWLANNPNATKDQIVDHYSLSDISFCTFGEGAGDYCYCSDEIISNGNDYTYFDGDYVNWEKLNIDLNQVDIFGKTNVLKSTLINGDSAHWINEGSFFTKTPGKIIKLEFDVYIPSSNTKVDGIRIFDNSSSVVFNYANLDFDKWIKILIIVPWTDTATNSNWYIQPLDGSVSSIDANGDVYYIANFTDFESDVGLTTIYGGAWQTAQEDGLHVSLSKFNTQEVNGETIHLFDVGDGTDILGNSITYNSVVNLDGISSYIKYTTTNTINSVSFYYLGDIIIKNGSDYYVNGVLQGSAPTPFPYYEDGNDRILGKSDGSTFHAGGYRNLLLADTLTTDQISLLANLLKIF